MTYKEKKEYQKKYYEKNKEQLRQYQKSYYQQHKEDYKIISHFQYTKKKKKDEGFVCDGDCFNCKHEDCIITDTELVKQMRKKGKNITSKRRKTTPFRIGAAEKEFKAEYILTPLPDSPEVKRKWGVKKDESQT